MTIVKPLNKMVDCYEMFSRLMSVAQSPFLLLYASTGAGSSLRQVGGNFIIYLRSPSFLPVSTFRSRHSRHSSSLGSNS
jgi:hypothetical protein